MFLVALSCWAVASLPLLGVFAAQITLVVLAVTWRAFRRMRRMESIYRLAPTRVLDDITAVYVERDTALQQTLDKIQREMGASALGVVRVAQTGGAPEQISHIFSDRWHTTVIEVLAESASRLTYFTTYFDNGAVIETAFPVGSTIQSTDYRVQVVETTLEMAYSKHRDEAGGWRAKHGFPIEIHALADYLSYDRRMRASHITKRLRLPRALAQVRFGRMAGFLWLSGALTIALWQGNITVLYLLLSGGIFALLMTGNALRFRRFLGEYKKIGGLY